MRIIAGEKRGLKLASLDGISTRPTKDNVREAIFSTLQNYIYGSEILDLFAGTGAIGLEALSRGAKHVDFVEWDKNAQKTLRENIEKCNYYSKVTLYQIDAMAYLEETRKTFDLIFLDPPYEADLYSRVLEKIAKRRLLKKDGVVVLEHKKNSLFLDENRLFLMYKTKVYGKSTVTYLKMLQEATR